MIELTESTLFIIKPDAQPARHKILADLLGAGFDLDHLTQTSSPVYRDIWARHYEEHHGRPFFEGLLDFMESGPVTVLELSGFGVIRSVRDMVGPTKILDAPPSTIRGRYARYSTGAAPSTLVHASDSPESADRELELWSRVCNW